MQRVTRRSALRTFGALLAVALPGAAIAGPFSNVGKGKKDSNDGKKEENPDEKLTDKEMCAKYGHDFAYVGKKDGPYIVPGFPLCTKWLRMKKCKRKGCSSNGSDIMYEGAPCPSC